MSKNYSGCSVSELCNGHDRWSFYIPTISISKHHSGLHKIPVKSSTPQPHISHNCKHWDNKHVKMPFSHLNLFLEKDSENGDKLIPRWKIICKALEKPIRCFSELQEAIYSYNVSLPKFHALEYLFQEVLSEDESRAFFEDLLPKIIKLALRLPEILPESIPLLKKNHNKSISLSQLQVSSLLANAFLCTFPFEEDIEAPYPGLDFVRLYSSEHHPTWFDCVPEKIKCLIHYFRRVTNSEPKGVITFERIFLPSAKIPKWDTLENNLGSTRVHITSTGTIEDDGLGFLQVDFANKNVGGGVLCYGCVQEEIRFVICPELLISRLFVEQLGDTEAVTVRGIERFSNHTGYGVTFKWSGNFIDDTPFDNDDRRQTTVTIMDAILFHHKEQQYHPEAMLRELGKAYAGFYSQHTDNLAPVATGNWGCGAFNGDPQLKSLIQLMACNAAHRDLVYYSFGNEELQDTFYNLYLFIVTNRITTCELWRIISEFAAAELPPEQFYNFIQQTYLDNKNKSEKEKLFQKNETDSSQNWMYSLKKTFMNMFKYFERKESSKLENSSQVNSNSKPSFGEDVNPSQLENPMPLKKIEEQSNFNEKLFEENHNEMLAEFSKIDVTVTNKNQQEGS